MSTDACAPRMPADGDPADPPLPRSRAAGRPTSGARRSPFGWFKGCRARSRCSRRSRSAWPSGSASSPRPSRSSPRSSASRRSGRARSSACSPCMRLLGALPGRLARRPRRASGSRSPPVSAIVAVSSAFAGLSTSYTQLLVLRGVGGPGLGDVHGVGARTAAARRRARPARPRRRGVPGRVPARRRRRPGGRRARARHLDPGAVLRVRRHARRRGRRRDHDAGPHPAARREGRGGEGRRRRPALGWHAAARRRCATAPTSPRSSVNLGNGFTAFGLRSALVPLFVVNGLGPRQGLGRVRRLRLGRASQAPLLGPARAHDRHRRDAGSRS